MEFTDLWSRYSCESFSGGATLRIAKDGEKFLLVRADAWNGEFNDVLSSHPSIEEAEAALNIEAASI